MEPIAYLLIGIAASVISGSVLLIDAQKDSAELSINDGGMLVFLIFFIGALWPIFVPVGILAIAIHVVHQKVNRESPPREE